MNSTLPHETQTVLSSSTDAYLHERLNDLAAPVSEPPIGFRIGAADIGRAASPSMQFVGPEREDEASTSHVGFWTQEV